MNDVLNRVSKTLQNLKYLHKAEVLYQRVCQATGETVFTPTVPSVAPQGNPLVDLIASIEKSQRIWDALFSFNTSLYDGPALRKFLKAGTNNEKIYRDIQNYFDYDDSE